MDLDEFRRSAAAQGWKVSGNLAFGVHKGYPFYAAYQPRFGGSAGLSLRVEGKISTALFKSIRKVMPKGVMVFHESHAEPELTWGCFGSRADFSILTESLDRVTEGLREAGIRASETCPLCNQRNCNATALWQDKYVSVHRDCIEQFYGIVTGGANAAIKGGNYLTGLLGALLGGTVGAIPVVLFLSILPYYLSIFTFATIPLGAYYGNRFFNGKEDKVTIFSILLSSALNLLTVVYLKNYIELSQLLNTIPTPVFVFMNFINYLRTVDFGVNMLTYGAGLLAGVIFVWQKISVTPVSAIRIVQNVFDSLMVDGKTIENARDGDQIDGEK